MVAWGAFPGTSVFQQLARILIPLALAAGLVVLNLRLFRRDGLPANALNLRPRQVGWFLVGGVIITPVILLIAAVISLGVPFHWERGGLTWTRVAWQFAEYTVGNSAEELIFRGYLLLILMRHVGLASALLAMALLFGAFHLPGLSGGTAVKMICTTAVGSYLFAYGYLITGSLWTAIGMHVWGNLLLHQILGLTGGASILRVVVHGTWPESWDPAFIAWMSVSGIAAGLGALLFRRTRSRALDRSV